MGRWARHGFGQRNGLRDLGKMRPARLLAGFERDSAPALQAFRGGLLETALAAGRFDGNDFRHAQLGGFFDNPLKAVELDEGGIQLEAGRRRRHGKLFERPENHAFLAGGLDLRQINVAVVGDFVALPGFHAQHAGEVTGLIALDLGLAVANLVYKKPPPHSDSRVLTPVFLLLMIAHLRGTLLEKHPNLVIVDTGGVGYEVTIPVSAYSSLPETGAEVQLHIHTHVREDALLLFGFVSAADKALFEKLITVSGIGPKLAVTTLGGLTAPDLAAAIREGSVEQLVRIPGVGKKTAERMVLELRDKLDLLPGIARAAAASAKSAFNTTEEDVISALGNFGVARAAAEAAVTKAKSATEGNDFDGLFRRALKLVR